MGELPKAVYVDGCVVGLSLLHLLLLLDGLQVRKSKNDNLHSLVMQTSRLTMVAEETVYECMNK
jgi:hypothetical protein